MKSRLFLLYLAVLLIPSTSFAYSNKSLIASVYCSTLGSWIRDASCVEKIEEKGVVKETSTPSPSQIVNQYINNPVVESVKTIERIVTSNIPFDPSEYVTKEFLKKQAGAIGEAGGKSTSNLSESIDSLTTSDISEGTNLYYTDARVAAYISASTTLSSSGSSQWTTSGSNIYYSTGSVGIGTTTPFATLAVNPTAGNASNQFVVGSSTATSFIIDNTGNVGIGTTLPAYGLHIYKSAGSATQNIQTADAAGEAAINLENTVRRWKIKATVASGDAFVIRDQTAGQDRFVIGNSGNIGIATSTPYAKLSVTSTAVGTTTFALRPVASQTANIMDIYSTTGTLSSVVTSSGNWGIGTTSPYGKLAVTNTGTDPSFVVEDSTSPDTTPFIIDASGNVAVGSAVPINRMTVVGSSLVEAGGSQGILALRTGTGLSNDESFQFGIVDGGYAWIQALKQATAYRNLVLNPSGGNVGIGTTTPGYKLEVSGSGTYDAFTTVTATGGNQPEFYLRRNQSGGSYNNGWAWYIPATSKDLRLYNDLSGTGVGDRLTVQASTGNIGLGTTSPWGKLSVTNTGTDPSFVVEDSTSPDTTPFIIDASGNVGIGTTTPSSKLTVSVSSSGGSSSGALGDNFVLESGADNYINILTPLTSNSGIIFSDTTRAMGGVIYAHNGDYMKFFVNGSEKIRIDSSGNVGIGTTTPAGKLSVTQSANTPAGGLWIAETGNTDFRSIYISDTSGTLSFFGGDTAGSLNTATLNSAGAWTNASDRSYKENIVDLNTKYNLDTLLSIQPRFYTMKGTGKPQIGFIAQELKLVLPEVVEGQEGTMGISYGNMVALLVTAIKDLNGKVEKIAVDIKALFAEKVETKEVATEKLCVGKTCITEDELKELLDTQNIKALKPTIKENASTTIESSSNKKDQSTTTEEVVESDDIEEVVDSNTSTTTQIVEEQPVSKPVEEEVKEPEPVKVEEDKVVEQIKEKDEVIEEKPTEEVKEPEPSIDTAENQTPQD